MSKALDKKVMEMRQSLLEKRQALLNSENPVYKTSGTFRPNFTSPRGEINIKTANKTQLIDAYVALNARNQAANALNIEPGVHLGYPVADWVEDFKTRISVIDRNDNLAAVNKLTAELSTLLTPSQKREIGIADLQSKIAEAVS